MLCPHCHKSIEIKDFKEEDSQEFLNYEERLYWQRVIAEMRPYLLMAKKYQLGSLKCERCGNESLKWHFHHLRYADNITLFDIELLCDKCHLNIPEVRKSDGLIE